MTSRRKFLCQTTALGTLFPFAPSTRFPTDPIPSAAVHEFVSVAHRDFDKTQALLEEYPHILNAAWDWGYGDYETAIGAAGHVGFRKLALYLLEKGARADLFVLTMLGETELVQTMLSRFPYLLNATGPHGFTLLHHAERGEEHAEELLAYLQQKGLREKKLDIYSK